MRKINVLVACEESQRVAKEFEKKGANAFSCDLQMCSGERPDIHILGDCKKLLSSRNIDFKTVDGKEHHIDKWDLMIAHPPCTYFSAAGARWMYANGKINEERYNKMLEMRELFYTLRNAPIDHIAIENPTPMKIAGLPPHDCVVQPYEHGHPFTKRTLLWLKNLPPITPTKINETRIDYVQFCARTSLERSKTFTGIAKAFADQWYDYVLLYNKIEES